MSSPSDVDPEKDQSPPTDGQSQQMPEVGELDYIGGAVKQALVLAVAILIVSLIAPQLFDRLLALLSESERLRTIRPWWFVAMLVAEIASFASLWWLIRILLPKVSWFVAATSQLTANSISRVVPGGGGAAAGGATLYRMLAVSGTPPIEAGGALAATSVLSTAALAAIPVIGITIALFGAPIPEGLAPISIASAVLCVLLLLAGALALRRTRPLLLFGKMVDGVLRIAGRVFKKQWRIAPETLIKERDRLADVLGERWGQATAASALNWTFDYLVLVFALYAVDAEPRLSLVMVAYAAGAVLSMISLTPGGFGFVELGLLEVLTLSGIPADRAAIAILAYRGLSLWMPIASGFFAWLAFQWKFPRRTTAGPA